MADLMDYLQKKLGNPNSLARQAGRNYFPIKPTYQGSGVGSLFILMVRVRKVNASQV